MQAAFSNPPVNSRTTGAYIGGQNTRFKPMQAACTFVYGFIMFVSINSLSFRLKTLTLIWLVAAAFSISLTLILSWQLEGGAAAINDVGSLRMQSYRLSLLRHNTWHNTAEINAKIQQFDDTINRLETGDPSRPLFLPSTPEVQAQMHQVKQQWQQQIRPMFRSESENSPVIIPESLAKLESFLQTINQLNKTVETVNTRYIQWLRAFQILLLMMVLVSAAITVLLLSRWVLRPLQSLQNGVQAVHDGHFGTQIPLEDSAEFALVGKGFNQMSTRLQELYGHLEHEVNKKTQDLIHKNRELATMYEVLHKLTQSQSVAEASTHFLTQIMSNFPAQAGSIRLIDNKRGRMDLIAHIGLPEVLQTEEACQRFDDCLCGQAAQNSEWQPIRFHEKHPGSQPFTAVCERSGFHYLSVFPICYKDTELGLMTLYFQKMPEEGSADALPKDLLNALCNQLGIALNHIRLVGENRLLAVLQERNLLAQGLHDSIAQSLTFLNLQVQMLESALLNDEKEQVKENLTFIREGVEECYDDVRELLLNFRTKITKKEFREAVETLTQRFEQQTHVPVAVEWHSEGLPLSSDQQLQFIFILQESLSNIRKHAQAKNVRITFDLEKDVSMTIWDDGRGFDVERLHLLAGNHVGLHIMRERAKRIRAELSIESQENHATRVRLVLPECERMLE